LREQLLEKDESLDDEFYFAEVTVRNTEADPSLDDPSRELESLESIMQSASHCYRYSASEAAWNQKMHYPLLELGFRHLRWQAAAGAYVSTPSL
jgi:hypothetical protein